MPISKGEKWLKQLKKCGIGGWAKAAEMARTEWAGETANHLY